MSGKEEGRLPHRTKESERSLRPYPPNYPLAIAKSPDLSLIEPRIINYSLSSRQSLIICTHFVSLGMASTKEAGSKKPTGSNRI